MKTKPLTFLFALTFLFLFSGSVYGQEEVKKEYYDNGKLKSEKPYNGLATWWYETGGKEQERHLKNGKEEGLTTFWYKTGEKELEALHKNGDLEGLATRWYKTGGKEFEVLHKNGKTEGQRKVWYETGEKKMKVTGRIIR